MAVNSFDCGCVSAVTDGLHVGLARSDGRRVDEVNGTTRKSLSLGFKRGSFSYFSARLTGRAAPDVDLSPARKVQLVVDLGEGLRKPHKRALFRPGVTQGRTVMREWLVAKPFSFCSSARAMHPHVCPQYVRVVGPTKSSKLRTRFALWQRHPVAHVTP